MSGEEGVDRLSRLFISDRMSRINVCKSEYSSNHAELVNCPNDSFADVAPGSDFPTGIPRNSLKTKWSRHLDSFAESMERRYVSRPVRRSSTIESSDETPIVVNSDSRRFDGSAAGGSEPVCRSKSL